MKRILPLALLLALAVPVGAEQEKYGCAITPEGRACLFSDRQIAQMERDQYCLATMEAAMKLMDQYLPLDVAFRVINWKREHPGEWTSVLLDELAAVQPQILEAFYLPGEIQLWQLSPPWRRSLFHPFLFVEFKYPSGLFSFRGSVDLRRGFFFSLFRGSR